MCLNPAKLPEGTEFGCRKCWQCRELRINDWAGRCIAESYTACASFAVTLTYGGGDHERAAVLTYSDVQKFMKRLRFAGYEISYLCAGEFGSKKGRAHWHLLLYFHNAPPRVELRKNIHVDWWPHGYTFWDDQNTASVKYVLKYMLKDVNDVEHQGYFMMSKVPMIGLRYHQKRALRYVEQGLSPKDLNYTLHESRNQKGELIKHRLLGSLAREFLESFILQWQARYNNNLWPQSECVDDHEDRMNKRDELTLRFEKRAYGVRPFFKPEPDSAVFFHEPRNTFYTKFNGETLWWVKQGEETYLWQGNATKVTRMHGSRKVWASGPDGLRCLSHDMTQSETPPATQQAHGETISSATHHVPARWDSWSPRDRELWLRKYHYPRGKLHGNSVTPEPKGSQNGPPLVAG